MDAQQFLVEFRHIASAPEGVQGLRGMIYNLAITGDLTEQLPEDGNAKALLEEIGRERQRRIKSKEFKRTAKLESEPLDIPVNIKLPDSWEWTRLLDISEISPRNDAYDHAPAAFIPMSGIPQLHKGKLEFELRNWGDIKKGYTHFANGDVVVAKITPCFENGKAAVISGLDNENGIGSGTTELHVLRPLHAEIHPDYIYIFLRSPFFSVKGEQSMTGTAGQKRLPTDYFAIRALPLPPFAEQIRIVTKVDELMALCDKLQSQQQKRIKLCDLTRNTVFRALAAVQSSQDLSDAWQRVSAHAGQLLDSPESVASYKGAILDLAMSGLLLPYQRKPEATGLRLLDEIEHQRTVWSRTTEDQEKKEALAMQKKIRVQQIVPPDSPLPDHWRWGSFLQISLAVVDCHNKTAPYVNEGIHLIRTTDIRKGRMNLKYTRKVSSETYAYWSRRMPPKPGDVFFTREAPMGEAAIVPHGEKVCLGQRTMLLRLSPELFNNQFLVYAIYSPSFQARMVEAAIGMTVKHLRVGGVEDLMVPVPPKVEQDQIVAIIDRLFAHCDHLAEKLAKKQKMGSNLAKASIEALTGIRAEEEKELKAPKTELVSKLRLGEKPNTKEQAPLASILARQDAEMAAKDLWQRFGGEIDVFYAQLKLEVNRGWILEPAVAVMREVEAG
jgi:type I restriction enzyme S subunit